MTGLGPVRDGRLGAIGFGAFNLSLDPRPATARAIETVHAALDAGIRLIDTADAYCRDAFDVGHNERLVRAAISSWSGDRSSVLVATKGGHVRNRSGDWLTDGSPRHLHDACDASLRALGVDAIDLYLLHRPDPAVPYLDSVGALAELQRAGKVRGVGVSNVTIAQIDDARSVVPLAAVQNELSLTFPYSIREAQHCAELAIPFLAWAPFGGRPAAPTLSRTVGPALADISRRLHVSPHQVALAWVRAQAASVVPLPGATRPETIRDSAAAASIVLDPSSLERLSVEAGAHVRAE